MVVAGVQRLPITLKEAGVTSELMERVRREEKCAEEVELFTNGMMCGVYEMVKGWNRGSIAADMRRVVVELGEGATEENVRSGEEMWRAVYGIKRDHDPHDVADEYLQKIYRWWRLDSVPTTKVELDVGTRVSVCLPCGYAGLCAGSACTLTHLNGIDIPFSQCSSKPPGSQRTWWTRRRCGDCWSRSGWRC